MKAADQLRLALRYHDRPDRQRALLLEQIAAQRAGPDGNPASADGRLPGRRTARRRAGSAA